MVVSLDFSYMLTLVRGIDHKLTPTAKKRQQGDCRGPYVSSDGLSIFSSNFFSVHLFPAHEVFEHWLQGNIRRYGDPQLYRGESSTEASLSGSVIADDWNLLC